MTDSMCKDFQKTVEQYLIRHQSILDILSKTQETNARINRAITKAVTQCGCVQIQGEKNKIPNNSDIANIKALLSNQVDGMLCEHCREVIEQELGKNLFYLTGLCNALGLDLEEVLTKEHQKIKTLRFFNLT
ncbi:MAG: DUF1573 domain-containing protein [Peptococcaceae bacterium]